MKFCPITPGIPGAVTFCDFPNRAGLTRKPLQRLEWVPQCTHSEIVDMAIKINTSKAMHIICSNQLKDRMVVAPGRKAYFVHNPRYVFMKLLEKYHPAPNGVRGHLSYGLNDFVFIGRNVFIGAGSVIGGPGFGMWRTRDGSIKAFRQIGKVVIEDDVEIHCNVCIDRGALGETRIGSGTKIDNLVHVAHNVTIGKHCVIVAQSMIGGGVTIGDRVWVGPGARLLNGIKVGDDAIIGMGAIVLRDVDADEKVHGVVK